VKAAPVLLIGAIVLRLLVWRLRTPRWKLPVSIVGASLLLAMAVVIYQPLTRAQQLAFVGEAGGARATYISTGLLPLRLEAVNGGHADLRAGQIGSILSTHADSHGKYPVSLKPHFPFWWWVVLVLACFLPAFWTLAFGLPPERLPKHRAAGAEA